MALLPYIGPLLRLGSTGAAVVVLQQELAQLGYKLSGTGYFGGATDTAVSDFQLLSRLTVDGIVGKLTATALDKAIPPTKEPVVVHVTRPLWLIEGIKWIGLKEGSGSTDNPTILKWAQEEGGSIAITYDHDSIPWCALFENMIFTKVGLKGTESLWALDWDSDTKWPNVRLPGPAVGAVAPMRRAGGGHIVTVAGRTRDGMLACLGGNQSDSVSINAFPLERPLSFRWPLNVSLPQSIGYQTLPLVSSNGLPLSEA